MYTLQWSHRIALSVIGFFLIDLPLYAAEATLPSQPLSITSKSMTVKTLDHIAIFDGNVVMTKADVTLMADHAEVTFVSADPPGETSQSVSGLMSSETLFGQSEISLIHATGHVVLQQAGKRAQSKEAFYYHQEERVVLTGEPVAWEKDYQVTGTRMTIFLREDRSVIEGSKVMIHPKRETP